MEQERKRLTLKEAGESAKRATEKLHAERMARTPVEEGEVLRRQDEAKPAFTEALEKARKQQEEGKPSPSTKR